jgi:hypothetical protein
LKIVGKKVILLIYRRKIKITQINIQIIEISINCLKNKNLQKNYKINDTIFYKITKIENNNNNNQEKYNCEKSKITPDYEFEEKRRKFEENS